MSLAVAAGLLVVACSKDPPSPERPTEPAGLLVVASESGTPILAESGQYVLEVANKGIAISSVSIVSEQKNPPLP